MSQKKEMMHGCFRCPSCYAALIKRDNSLICEGQEQHTYEIQQGIPMFVAFTDFDEHWHEHGTSNIPAKKRDVANKFLQPVFAKVAKGSRLLDVGCGDGVHAMTILSKLKQNVSYLGVDISLSALLATKTHSGNANLLGGDATKLPINDNSFDVVFSYGVLGYSGKPQQGLQEMARVLKPSGLLGVWLAPKPKGLLGALLSLVRTACNLGGKRFTNFTANAIVPFLSILPVASGVNLKNASWKQCKEVVMVNIEPKTLVYPTREEVMVWLDQANLRVIEEDKINPITFWASPK